jgi:hypothetical protein
MQQLKLLFFIVFLSNNGWVFSQSDWALKPYVIVNDSLYIEVKHPVFIMDSTLYVRTKDSNQVLTFPTKDINYISKRCFYHRLSEGQQNRLSNSINTNAYLSSCMVITGSVFSVMGIEELIYFLKNPGVQTYYGTYLITGLTFIVPATLLIRSMVLKKLRTRMILESKGLRFS